MRTASLVVLAAAVLVLSTGCLDVLASLGWVPDEEPALTDESRSPQERASGVSADEIEKERRAQELTNEALMPDEARNDNVFDWTRTATQDIDRLREASRLRPSDPSYNLLIFFSETPRDRDQRIQAASKVRRLCEGHPDPDGCFKQTWTESGLTALLRVMNRHAPGTNEWLALKTDYCRLLTVMPVPTPLFPRDICR